MTPNLASTSAKLLSDVQKVCAAYDACASSISAARERFKDNSLQISPNIEFALWADLKFNGDWSAFSEYVHTAIENYPSRGGAEGLDKSQLWVFNTPDQKEPILEVDRILDRIDVALHFLTKELSMDLPFKTVRESGWHQREHVQRVLAFATGLADVVNPKG